MFVCYCNGVCVAETFVVVVIVFVIVAATDVIFAADVFVADVIAAAVVVVIAVVVFVVLTQTFVYFNKKEAECDQRNNPENYEINEVHWYFNDKHIC